VAHGKKRGKRGTLMFTTRQQSVEPCNFAIFITFALKEIYYYTGHRRMCIGIIIFFLPERSENKTRLRICQHISAFLVSNTQFFDLQVFHSSQKCRCAKYAAKGHVSSSLFAKKNLAETKQLRETNVNNRKKIFRKLLDNFFPISASELFAVPILDGRQQRG
jgi:hypothetical protein